MNRTPIPIKTVKILFARSQNRCAFPGCSSYLVDQNEDVVYGKVCHIEGVEPGSARHNPSRPVDRLNDIDNLILLCDQHHTQIDTMPNKYPADWIKRIKSQHEQQGPIEIMPSDTRCATIMLDHMNKEVHVYNDCNLFNATGNATQNISITNVKVTRGRRMPVSVPTSGTVGTDAIKRSYVKHLYDRLVDFKKLIPKYNFVKAGSIIARDVRRKFGATWSNVPIERYDELVDYLKRQIDKTPVGKSNAIKGIKNYSSQEEFFGRCV